MSTHDTYFNLMRESEMLFRKGDYRGAIATIGRAERSDPLVSVFGQIQRAMQQGDHQQASVIAQEMLQLIPFHPRAVFTLAHLHALRGEHEERANLLIDAIKHAPANLFLRRQSVAALEDSGDFVGAIESARALIKIEASFESILGLMQVLLRHGFNEDVLKLTDKAYSLCQKSLEKRSEVDLLRGQALKILGMRPEAIAALRDCLTHKASGGAAWWALADMKNYRFSDKDMKAMKTVLRNQNTTSDHRVQAGFALAKAHELNGDLSVAMDFYDEANGMHGTRGFQGERFMAAVESLSKTWNAETISMQGQQKKGVITPIFILGMPRSGSTLVEQILASHSQIEGTMEMMVLPSIKRKTHILCQKKFQKSYLESVKSLNAGELTKLGLSYLQGSALYRKENKPFVIDKLPNNFEHIGLIHKILPHAKIIDVRRHPMDCGYSIYKQYFRSGAHYSYDLSAIGNYYNGYLSLMDHWSDVLPAKVLEVRYEALVKNTKSVIQNILEFIGVDFEPGCLEFYNNKRPVRTASSEQVRQPIHSRSVGAWQDVEKRLVPLRESLGKVTLERLSSPFISEPS